MPSRSLQELEEARDALHAATTDTEKKTATERLIRAEIAHNVAIGVPMVNSRSQRALPYVLIFTLLVTIAVVVKASNLASDTAESVRPILENPCQAPGPELTPACVELRLKITQGEPLKVPCTSFRRIVEPRHVFKEFTRCGDRSPSPSKPTENGATDEATQGTAADERPAAGSEPAQAPDDGGDGGGSPGPDPSDPPAANPEPPEPPAPSPEPPPPAPDPKPPSLGGMGLDVPLVPECDLLPALCSQP